MDEISAFFSSYEHEPTQENLSLATTLLFDNFVRISILVSTVHPIMRKCYNVTVILYAGLPLTANSANQLHSLQYDRFFYMYLDVHDTILTNVDKDTTKLTLLRLYHIDKLFSSARKLTEEEEEPSLPQFQLLLCSHILGTRIPLLIELMKDCTDQLISYTAMRTLKEIIFSYSAIRELLVITPASSAVFDVVKVSAHYDSLWDIYFTGSFCSKTFPDNLFSFFLSLTKLNRKALLDIEPDNEAEAKNRVLDCIAILSCIEPRISHLLSIIFSTQDIKSYHYILLSLLFHILKFESTDIGNTQVFMQIKSQLCNALSQMIQFTKTILELDEAGSIDSTAILLVKRIFQIARLIHRHAWGNISTCSQSFLPLNEIAENLFLKHPNIQLSNVTPTMFIGTPESIRFHGRRTIQRLFCLLIADIIASTVLPSITNPNTALDERKHAVLLLKQIAETSVISGIWSRDSVENGEVILDNFREQDDQLVQILYSLMMISTSVCNIASSLQSNTFFAKMAELVLDTINPHVLFFKFLESVGFDHQFLLDLLISNETEFLAYFNFYLKHLIKSWATVRNTLSQIPYSTAMDIQISAQLQRMNLSENGAGDSDDEGTAIQTLRALLSSDDTPKQDETAIDAVAQTLIRLKFQCEQLVHKGLFPFNIKPLLRKLQQVEDLYEEE